MERLLYALIQLTARANQQILAVSKQVTQMPKGARLNRPTDLPEIRAQGC
jgi:hypothetical protein